MMTRANGGLNSSEEREEQQMVPAHGRNQMHGPDRRNLQLHFRPMFPGCMFPDSFFTTRNVEGQGGAPIHVDLIDTSRGHVVRSGPESCVKLKVVVVEGDFNREDDDDWTQEDFESCLVKEREGKSPLLIGKLHVHLKGGVGSLGKFSFTDTSRWTRSQKFRLGVKVASGLCEGIRVLEAITDPFAVKDCRGEVYKKHPKPALDDDVWRLKHIKKNGPFHERLNKNGIFRVKDFLWHLRTDPKGLRKILGSSIGKMKWDALVKHVETCDLRGKHYADNTKNSGVVFKNMSELCGLTEDGKYYLAETLLDSQKVSAHTLKKEACANWKNIVEYDSAAVNPSKRARSSQTDVVTGAPESCRSGIDQLVSLVFPTAPSGEASEKSMQDFEGEHFPNPSEKAHTLSSSEMAQSCWKDLPEELWKAIFDRIKPTEYHHLESISLVCQRFLSISNRLRSALNVSTRMVLLAPDHRDISPLFRRFHHLKQINFSASLSKVSVKNIVKAISRSDLRLTALDLSNAKNQLSYFAIHDLGRKMKDTMRSLICADMSILNDQDLYQIAASFPDLEELDISNRSNYDLSDVGISEIAEKLQKLRSINISGNRFISDVSLIKLSSLSSLSKISARNCGRLTISGIDYLIQHRSNLLSLSITINPISSSQASIGCFRANASNLQSLDLSATCVSDELLSVIGNHNLVLLKLALSFSHGFTFDGLSALVCGQQSLQHLNLGATRFLTDEMMSSLSEHLPHLISIGLDHCTPLTSSTFFNLTKNCPSLEEIRMSETSFGLGGEDLASELGKNCKIQSLKLRYNENLRDETLERIGTLCPELRSLDVSGCWRITGVGIGGIGKYCTKITELRIDRCRKVRNLGLDLQFSKLEVLVASASGIEDEGLEMIGRGCQRLQMLDMNGCLGVTEEGIRELLKSDSSCKVLIKLNLKHCCDLSADFFAWMVSSSPSLRTIILSSGSVPTKQLWDLLLGHGVLVTSAE